MRVMKALLLGAACSVNLAWGQAAQRSLTIQENLKSSHAVIATALTVAGLTNFRTEDIQNLLVQVFHNHATLPALAEASGCPNFVSVEQTLPAGPCFCTDNAEVFDQWVAPVFTPTTGRPVSELFETRESVINGYATKLMIDRNGTVKGGLLKSALHNKMKFRIFVSGVERGEKGRQQFCNFAGKFRLFTRTIDGHYIGVDIAAFGRALRDASVLNIDRIVIHNGEVSIR